MAMGIFEGHMSRMADGFKAVRMAEIELNGGYNKQKHEEFFTYFDWKQFDDESFTCARRWSRSAAMARCTTSASRTSRA
jgi:hypothetical protein